MAPASAEEAEFVAKERGVFRRKSVISNAIRSLILQAFFIMDQTDFSFAFLIFKKLFIHFSAGKKCPKAYNFCCYHNLFHNFYA
jgi:hypothetical protein